MEAIYDKYVFLMGGNNNNIIYKLNFNLSD